MASITKKWLPFALLIGAVLVSIGLVASKPKPEMKPVKSPVVLVEATSIQPAVHQVVLESQGEVFAKTRTSLSAQVGGNVIRLAENFVNGGFFQKGDILLQLDQTDYEVAVTRAEANLASRNAQLTAEKARADQALRDWKAGGKGKASDLVLRKPYVDEALAGVKAAQADLKQAQTNLKRTSIRAPYDGMVTLKSVDLGQYINPGMQLGTIIGTDLAEIRMPLTENDLAYLPLMNDRPTEVIDVELSFKNGDTLIQRTARLTRTEGIADSQSRVIYVVAELNDPYNRTQQADTHILRNGSFVKARIPGKRYENTWALSRHLLQGTDQLLLTDDSRKLRIATVNILSDHSGKVLIDQGIKPGEMVITTAISAPVSGMKLRLPDDPEPQAESSNPENEPEEGLAEAERES